LSLFLISCGIPQISSQLSESQTPTVTTQSGEEQTVTLDDDRKTITLRVGEHFLLKLGDTLSWKVTVSDESIVSRVPNVTVVKGAQGIYAAKKAGETNLDAAGSPICEPQAPCPAFVRAFRVRVEVR
jgi:hypothetical protein